MKNRFFISMVTFLLLFCFSCNFSKDKEIYEVYVPNAWDSGDCIHELRSVWIVQLPSEKINHNDTDTMKKLISRIWEADKAGKDKFTIRSAVDKRTFDDIISNGI